MKNNSPVPGIAKPIFSVLIFFLLSIGNTHSQNQGNKTERPQILLSGEGWKVWLDERAQWTEDTLYLPNEFELNDLPTNPPTCGWKKLNELGIACKVPFSIEEIFSKGINNWQYHGVSWAWRTFIVPKNWEGKIVKLNIGKARLRVEIYINKQLAGYDIIAETPIEADISEFLNYGNKNNIAIRLTNPGGNRGWEDFPNFSWGKYKLPPSHDFSGIDGEVTITALNNVHITDIFVKNALPANGKRVDVLTTVNKGIPGNESLTATIDIYPFGSNEKIHSETFENIDLSDSRFIKTLEVPNAKLWDIDTPNLYYCQVSLYSNRKLVDSYKVRFGFRVFEVKAVDNHQNYYLNGKRIRFRSAIDWGYYALTGFYATREMAQRSVQTAKDIGHNALNFHRRIGEPLIFEYADEMGLYLYEESGGFHAGLQPTIRPNTFTAKIMEEKCRRMVIRDRNHPSLMIYNLSNEDYFWNELKEKVMRMMHDLDGTRLICSSSGWLNIHHIRPYQDSIKLDYIDDHTVGSSSRFSEEEFKGHETYNDSNIIYWGEVRCYTGPPNWYSCYNEKETIPNKGLGYDLNIYKPLHDKIIEYYDQNSFKNIRSYEDITKQAGRGLMYIDGRIGQVIMSYNAEDGYAINGWSGGPQLPDPWGSAIVDEGRNLKGPADDFKYWIREKQIAIFRQNGKYFNVGDTAKFNIHLINEGKIPSGEAILTVKIKDGKGKYVYALLEKQIDIKGGDTFAQKLVENTEVIMKEEWNAGYITVEAKLYQDSSLITDGYEQVLLKNRKSYFEEFKGYKGAVINWLPAQNAIKETGNPLPEYSDELKGKLDYVMIGFLYKDINVSEIFRIVVEKDNDVKYEDINMKHVKEIFNRVYNDGTVLLLRFDDRWADYLFELGILAAIPREWRGTQTGGWNGNGWGYIDHFIGDQAIPSKSTIGTNSWEVPGDPSGFYPFKANYPQTSYGAFFARHSDLVTTLGTIKYGKGLIILNPSYWIDDNHAFTDMLFYNLISMSINELKEKE